MNNIKNSYKLVIIKIIKLMIREIIISSRIIITVKKINNNNNNNNC
jgi:hypothetical protein